LITSKGDAVKKLLLVLMLLVGSSCNQNHQHHNCKMIYNADSQSYEVWQNNNLLLEFNARNTDSASLETLEYITSTVIEFSAKK